MAATAWKTFARGYPDQQYLVLLSFLPLKSGWTIPRLILHTRRIMKQLNGTHGLLGYSVLARPREKHFWTLSAWENEKALTEFIQTGPHLQTTQALSPLMGETKFIRWRLTGSQLPPTWPDALRRWSGQ